ncbi:MAG: hypothetical protein N2544_12855 [Burkholderiales bacterium]|nr:hypothetical protein [Burkholderiales bacterium]
MRPFAATLATAALGASLAPGGAAAQIACPADLTVEQRAAAPSSEWTVGTSGHRPLLAGVTIYDGPPDRHVEVKPDRETTAKEETTVVWELAPGRGTYWLSCEYTHTNLVIARPLPRDIRRCQAVRLRGVTFGDSRPPVKAVACRGDPAVRSREGASIHRGTVVLGQAGPLFTPCGAQTRYWVVDDTPNGELERIYRQLAPQGEPLFVDVHGFTGPPPDAAVRAKLERALSVTELRRAAPADGQCAEDLAQFEVRARGVEPAWTLDVSRERMSFRRDGAEAQSFPYASPQPAGGGLLYAVKVDGSPPQAIGVLVRRERCVDPATGAIYSLSAEVGVGGEKLKGCAWAGEAARQAGARRGAALAPPAEAAPAAAQDARKAAATAKKRPAGDAPKR